MNQLSYFAHAGHVHPETELGATQFVPLPLVIAGLVLVLFVVIAGVILSRIGNKNGTPFRVASDRANKGNESKNS